MAESLDRSVEWVYVTAGSEEEAVRLARVVLDEKLAACANLLGGIRSLYRWQGELCDEQEVAMVLKTTSFRVKELMDRLSELHSYQTPCILAFSAHRVEELFSSWVVSQVEG
jgi:periplasmic divalent cation tolerance protein